MNDNGEEDREIPGLKRIVSSLPVDHAGTFVYLRGWRAEQSRWPPIVFVHDLGEQADHYAQAAENFVQKGFTSYAFDLRGHGRSGRLLGHLSRFDLLIKDLLQVAAWVKHREQGKAPIIIGHGIGALITAEFVSIFKGFCGGVVLSAPCFQLQKPPSLFLRSLLKVSSEVWPTWRPPKMLVPNFTEFLASPLRLTSSSITTLLSAMKKSEKILAEFPTRALILCPETDSIASYQIIKKNIALHQNDCLKTVDLGGICRNVFTSTQENRVAAIDEITKWLSPLAPWTNSREEIPTKEDSFHNLGQDEQRQFAINDSSQEASFPKE